MYKKGGAVNKSLGGRRNWLKRWFVLERQSRRGGRDTYTLRYFESPKGKEKGSVELEGTEVFCERRTQHTNKNVKYEFQIQMKNGSALQLSCEDFKERDEWIESLNYAITSTRIPVVERASTFVKTAHAGYVPKKDDLQSNFQLGYDIAQHCQAYGSGLYGAEAGQPAEFMIQVCDPSGQQIKTGGIPFTSNLCDDTCLYHIGVHDNGNGTHSAFYVISRPGSYELSILLNDEHHIYGSPFNVEVLPASTDPTFCHAFGECIQKKIIPDVVSTFTIIAKDAYGNNKGRGGDPFEVGVMGPAKLLGLEDNGDGTYICSLQAIYPRDQPYLTAAAISVMVTLHGKQINGSPFRPVIDLSKSNPNPIPVNKPFDPRMKPFSTPSNSARTQPNPALSRSQGQTETGSTVQNNYSSAPLPKPPPIEPTPTNKLEAARLRALEAAKDLPAASTKDLVARALQNSATESTPSHRNNLPTNVGPPSTTRTGKLDQLLASTSRSSRADPPLPPRSVSQSAAPPNPTPSALSSNPSQSNGKLATRMSKLDQMAQKMGSSRILQSSQPQAESQSQGQSTSNRIGPPPPPPGDLMDNLSSGLFSPPPDDLPSELRRLWSVTHESLHSREIVNLLATNVIAIQSSFSLAAEPPTYRLGFLVSETGNSAGLYRLFEEFDVVPAYLTKKELKNLYDLTLRFQALSGAPPASLISSQGKEGIELLSFMKLLLMTALFCLSKTQAFNSLYATPKAKADVMLFNWGFADPLKIRSVQDRL